MSTYQYTLSFQLASDCPPAVTDFFNQLASGDAPQVLPEADEGALEATAAEVIALLTGLKTSEQQVSFTGSATAEAFYMPFIALAEWLAQWSETRGPVGFYHQPSLLHPTLVYFADGKPYMLQATGTPVGFADGEAMEYLQATNSDTDADGEETADAGSTG